MALHLGTAALLGPVLPFIAPLLLNAFSGMVAGGIILAVVELMRK